MILRDRFSNFGFYHSGLKPEDILDDDDTELHLDVAAYDRDLSDEEVSEYQDSMYRGSEACETPAIPATPKTPEPIQQETKEAPGGALEREDVVCVCVCVHSESSCRIAITFITCYGTTTQN